MPLGARFPATSRKKEPLAMAVRSAEEASEDKARSWEHSDRSSAHSVQQPPGFLSPVHSACPSASRPGSPFRHHHDRVLHCGPGKFICCHALYIPHNSAAQALLCMCLIFTVRKTDGDSDSPDILEGCAPALPWKNLSTNSIRG